MPDSSSRDQLITSLYALSVLGVGEILGSLLMSQVVDRVSNKAGVVTNILLLFPTWTSSFLMISKNEPGLLVYLFTLSWGLMDGAVNTHAWQILGFEFESA